MPALIPPMSPEAAEPEVPALEPFPEIVPLAAGFAGVGPANEFGCCAWRAERSSICRRCRLGAELSSRSCSTDELTTAGGFELPPFVINSSRGGNARTVFCWMRMLSGTFVFAPSEREGAKVVDMPGAVRVAAVPAGAFVIVLYEVSGDVAAASGLPFA